MCILSPRSMTVPKNTEVCLSFLVVNINAGAAAAVASLYMQRYYCIIIALNMTAIDADTHPPAASTNAYAVEFVLYLKGWNYQLLND